MARFP